MRFAFVAYNNSFQYYKIGGTDAIVRRISNYLSTDNEIYLLNYGLNDYCLNEIKRNIIEINFITFQDMLKFIKENNICNSISIYIKPADRLKLYLFQRNNKSLMFHTIITAYNERIFKRWALFLESIFTYTGNIYCVSSRIYLCVNRISKKALLLLPPVDDEFFKDNQASKNNNKIRISYMGRLDYGKGADIAYNFFINSGFEKNKYEFYIYAYPWKNDKFSIDLHNKLLAQSDVTYIESKLHDKLTEADKSLMEAIDNTDVFFLPYRFMQSTIDAPLVPMEIMSRNKLFISTNINGIKDISYDESSLIDLDNIEDMNIIKKHIKVILEKEIVIQEFIDKLGYKTSTIADKLVKSIKTKDVT